MPLALFFAFKWEWGVSGLWFGFSIACVILDIGFYMIIQCANWEKVAYEISKRMEEEERLRREAVRHQLVASVGMSNSHSREMSKLLVASSNHLDDFSSLIQLNTKSMNKYRL